MARTARLPFKKVNAEKAAEKLRHTVRRYGLVSKSELREAFRRVVDTDGVEDAKVNKVSDEAYRLIPEVDEHIVAEREGLQFYMPRGPRS